MPPPPVLVLGAQRSGTTLLRWCLDAHPSIAIGPETGFLRAIGDVLAAPAIGREDRLWSDGWSVADEQVEAAFAAAFDRVFQTHAVASGATRWGEKTPVNLAYPHRLARTFPQALLVAIVRHPLAVAASLQRWGWSSSDAVRYWRLSAERLVQHAHLAGDRFHLVRFEDLVADPEPVLRGVLEHLGEQWDAAVLDPRNADGAAVSDGGNVRRRIEPARAGAWTDAVGEAEVALLAPHADALDWFGYAADVAAPVGPLPTPVFADVAVPDRPDSVQPPEERWRARLGLDDHGDRSRAVRDPAEDRSDRRSAAPAPRRDPVTAAARLLPPAVTTVVHAVRRRGPAGVLRRAAVDVRDRGLRAALRRWWRLLTA